MLSARVIVNPVAGAGRTARRWPEIMALLKSLGLHFEHDLTEAPGHAVELAKSAAKDGYKLIVAVGGDGTINEVASGLYDSGVAKDAMLGIINTGSGGDYIRSIGIPRQYREACYHLISPGRLTVDLGVVEYETDGQKVRRLFLNFAGLGFDAEVVRATTQRFKTLGSTPSYLMGLLTTFLFYHNQDISLVVDGKVEARRICAVIVSNGKYGGGGMLVAPNADPADGLLDVVIIGDLSKPDLIWSLPRIYKGTHLTHPRVTVKRAREIVVKSGQGVSLQADGELIGKAPARFYILPAALNIVV